MQHAKAFDKMQESGIEAYTCPILSGYQEDHREDRREEDWSMEKDVRYCVQKSIFGPIRNREDFQEIFG